MTPHSIDHGREGVIADIVRPVVVRHGVGEITIRTNDRRALDSLGAQRERLAIVLEQCGTCNIATHSHS